MLVGLNREDLLPEGLRKLEKMLAKVPQLRIFPDAEHHMNRSILEFGGNILLVSQFTLYADCRKGRRPSFHCACPPDKARELYAKVCNIMEALLPGRVQSGVFGADMEVALTNWGPVTIVLDTDEC